MEKTSDEYYKSLAQRGSKPGLERIRELLSLLGNPQKDLNIINIAGTNGKGSVCIMLEGILNSAGYKPGLFLSPPLIGVEECIRANKIPIAGGDFSRLCSRIRTEEGKMHDLPTEFEVQTAAALMYFRDLGCNPVLLEAGMGGRLDSTNVGDPPCLSVITDIALDHTEYLGAFVREIASEKAGIIKRGTPAVFGGRDREAFRVIKAFCKTLGAPLETVDFSKLRNVRFDLEKGTMFDFGDMKDIALPLLGAYQPVNATIALTAANSLRALGFKFQKDNIYEGFKNLHHRGRFEVLSKTPAVIYDGAHNPSGMLMTAKSLEIYFGKKKAVLLMGVLKNKDYGKMAEIIAPYGARVFAVAPNNPNALDGRELVRCFEGLNLPAEACKTIGEACKKAVAFARRESLPTVILGSLYMYSDLFGNA